MSNPKGINQYTKNGSPKARAKLASILVGARKSRTAAWSDANRNNSLRGAYLKEAGDAFRKAAKFRIVHNIPKK